MYFEDPAGNVVELIGRRKRDLFGDPSFAEAFLNISEVGVVTPHLEEVSDELQDIGLPLRGAVLDADSVNFLGKDEAFFVLVRPGRKWYFSDSISEVFPLTATLETDYTVQINEEGIANIEKA